MVEGLIATIDLALSATRDRQMNPRLNIIHEDEQLLVINKPAGLVCHPTKGDAWSSLISRARMHLGEEHALHMIHRLDRETSGVCIFAKSDEAAGHLRRLFEHRRISKEYRAIVHGWPEPTANDIDQPIGRDADSPVAIKRAVTPDGSAAQTAYKTLNRFAHDEDQFALLDVQPTTGRTHQIRVHLAHIGHPIVGDKIYGVAPDSYLDFVNRRMTAGQRRHLRLPCQALHAQRIEFKWHGQPIHFEAEPETMFSDFIARRPAEEDWSERYV